MGNKDNKVDNKTVYKEKGKGEKEEGKKKKIEIGSPRNQVQILVSAHARKTKKSSPIKSN